MIDQIVGQNKLPLFEHLLLLKICMCLILNYISTLFLQAFYFDRDDIALHNVAKFFKEQSHEEREHAEKLMKYQNKRGGRIVLQDVKVKMYLVSSLLLGCDVQTL